jgi:hypothetical protein
MKQKYRVKIKQGSSIISNKNEISNLEKLFSSTCEFLGIVFGSSTYEEKIIKHGSCFSFFVQFEVKGDLNSVEKLVKIINGMDYHAISQKI